MTEPQIEILRAALKVARSDGGRLFWTPDAQAFHEVVAIGEAPLLPAGDVPEPSLVAFLADGTYAALYNADLSEFKELRPVVGLKQEPETGETDPLLTRFQQRALRQLNLSAVPAPSGQDYRASGNCVCSVCSHIYYEHPYDMEQLDYRQRPYLHVLCNGDRVHL